MITRRHFLTALGIGTAAVVIEEPIRKLWFVGSNAPVGSRIERPEFVVAQLTVDRDDLLRQLWTKVRSQEDLDTVRNAALVVETQFAGLERQRLMEDFDRGLRDQGRRPLIYWEPVDFDQYERQGEQPWGGVATVVLAG